MSRKRSFKVQITRFKKYITLTHSFFWRLFQAKSSVFRHVNRAWLSVLLFVMKLLVPVNCLTPFWDYGSTLLGKLLLQEVAAWSLLRKSLKSQHKKWLMRLCCIHFTMKYCWQWSCVNIHSFFVSGIYRSTSIILVVPFGGSVFFSWKDSLQVKHSILL